MHETVVFEIKPWVEILVASNRSFLIFWASMFMTSTLGLVRLLSQFPKANQRKTMYFLLFVLMYLGLTTLSFVSSYSLLSTYNVSRNLALDGHLGPEIKEMAIYDPTFIDSFLCEKGGRMIQLRMNLAFFPAIFYLFFLWVAYKQEESPPLERETQTETNNSEIELPNLIMDDNQGYITERASLIRLTSDKIKEHINYLFGLLALTFTLIQIDDTFIFYYISIDILLATYIIGRLMYWNVFSSDIMTHRPYNMSSLSRYQDSNVFQSNMMQGIYASCKYHIQGTHGYDRRNGIQFDVARFFSTWKKPVKYLLILYFIVLFILYSIGVNL